VIASFKDPEAKRIWQGEFSRRLPQGIQEVARRKLRMLNAARTPPDLKVPPANRLEALKGTRAGQFSVRINDRWRICFRFAAGQASDVEIADYH